MSVSRRFVTFAHLPDGTEARFPLIEITGHASGKTAVFIAGIHGDEYEGPAALWQLAEMLEGMPLAGRVLIVPIAHGAAFNAGLRESPVDGLNLARVSPGDPAGRVTERLAHALMTEVVAKADLLVDSHSGGRLLAFVPVAGFYAEGPEAAASLQLARQMGLPHLWQLPPVPGVLSFEAAKRGIPVTGAEIGGRGNARPGDVAMYLDAYLSVLRHNGMLAGDGAGLTRHLLRGDWTVSPVAGYLQPLVTLGAQVRAGDPLARVLSSFGETLHTFHAAEDGFIMAERHLNTVAVGDLAVCVVQESMV
jgi:N-alpha-acetyl-L-2,4-diaminobutyrate deacetylase